MRPLAVIALALVAFLLSAFQTRADYYAGWSAAERGDFATALREWEPLAEQGHPRAQTDLGYMYASGFGVPKDDARAVQLYRLAAEQAKPQAQFNLGYMYMFGRGVERDYAEGLRWYQRAARQGFLSAQFNLGVRYYTGEGTERDLGEAYFWFALAEQGGHARAQRSREGIEKLLSDEEKVAASERLMSWNPAESRIVGVQTGAHPDFDRVVLQLDRPTEVTRPGVKPGEFEVIVAAIPDQEQQVVGREGTRLGRVAVRRDSRGTRVSLVLGERVVRVFTLPSPPRVVIDLGVAGLSPFLAPRDGTPVHPPTQDGSPSR